MDNKLVAFITGAIITGGAYLGLNVTGPYFICTTKDVKLMVIEGRTFVACGNPSESDKLEALKGE